MLTTIKSISVACLLGVLALGSTGSYAYTTSCPDTEAYPLNGCSLPGVVNGSFPYFDNVVQVTYGGKKLEKDGSWTLVAKNLKGSQGTLVVSDEEQYTIDKLTYKLNAKVDDGGAYGEVKISGVIDGNKIDMSAFLNPPKDNGKVDKDSRGLWDVSADNMLFGFNTYGIKCNDALNALANGCTKAEVAFLNLLSPIGPYSSTATQKKVVTSGTALTSVPLPAAAWLFGSGLLGLIAVSRRSGRAV